MSLKLISLVVVFSLVSASDLNLEGKHLSLCSTSPMTGFFRTGYCTTGPSDHGTHTVCAQVNEGFLSYTKAQGNDLSTPRGGFPGLKPGDLWCLCALRWRQALQAAERMNDLSIVPLVNLDATNVKTLEYVDLQTLQNFGIE